jgi:hypothetical protein
MMNKRYLSTTITMTECSVSIAYGSGNKSYGPVGVKTLTKPRKCITMRRDAIVELN